jgi:hypothetical protein
MASLSNSGLGGLAHPPRSNQVSAHLALELDD